MYRIYKITSDHVVDFAAEELKKYLRMMMPRCGEIEISYDPTATDGFRLGLMQDFGLDTSEAQDTYLDDILHIDTTKRCFPSRSEGEHLFVCCLLHSEPPQIALHFVCNHHFSFTNRPFCVKIELSKSGKESKGEKPCPMKRSAQKTATFGQK